MQSQSADEETSIDRVREAQQHRLSLVCLPGIHYIMNQQPLFTISPEQEDDLFINRRIEAIVSEIAALVNFRPNAAPEDPRFTPSFRLLDAILRRSQPPPFASFPREQLLPSIRETVNQPDLLHTVLIVMDYNHLRLQQQRSFRLLFDKVPDGTVEFVDNTVAKCLGLALPIMNVHGRSMPTVMYPGTAASRIAPVIMPRMNPSVLELPAFPFLPPLPPTTPAAAKTSTTLPSGNSAFSIPMEAIIMPRMTLPNPTRNNYEGVVNNTHTNGSRKTKQAPKPTIPRMDLANLHDPKLQTTTPPPTSISTRILPIESHRREPIHPNKKSGVVYVSKQKAMVSKPWARERLLYLYHLGLCHLKASTDSKTNTTCSSHILQCRDRHCLVPDCVPSRALLAHYQCCRNVSCGVCEPVRKEERKRLFTSSKKKHYNVESPLKKRRVTIEPCASDETEK